MPYQQVQPLGLQQMQAGCLPESVHAALGKAKEHFKDLPLAQRSISYIGITPFYSQTLHNPPADLQLVLIIVVLWTPC